MESKVSGIFGYLVNTFVSYINGKISRSVNGFQENRKEISVKFGRNVFQVVQGYPLFSTKHCFVLPIFDEMLADEYLRRPFSDRLWILLMCFVLFFTTALRIGIFKDSFLCFFESLQISCGSSHQILKSSNSLKRLIYIQLFVYGFIIWNLYSAKMSSYLSSTNRGRELNTIEDIRKEKLTIWATFAMFNDDFYFKKVFPNSHFYKEQLEEGKFFQNITKNDFNKHVYSLNNSYGYLVPDYGWSFISLIQSLLTRKIFSVTTMCPEYSFLYPIHIGIRPVGIKEAAEMFYMRVLESGLYIIWQQFTYNDMKLKILKPLETNVMVLGFKFYKIAGLIGGAGISLSCFVFLIELILEYFRK